MFYLARNVHDYRNGLVEWLRKHVAINTILFQRCWRDNPCSRVNLDSSRPLPYLSGCFKSSWNWRERVMKAGITIEATRMSALILASLIINRLCFISSCHIQNIVKLMFRESKIKCLLYERRILELLLIVSCVYTYVMTTILWFYHNYLII